MKLTAQTLILGTGLFALAACQADKANAPHASQNTNTQAVDAVAETPAASDVDGLRASLDDAAARLAPALEDPGSAAELSAQLRALSQALAAGNAIRARAALVAARNALARAGLSPDGAAIGLALDRAEERLSTGMLDGSSQSLRGTADVPH